MRNVRSDRDQSIERLLRETLETRGPAASGQCLDAETVAAWSDDALSLQERTAAEAHVADCARCQALLAAMARTNPPVVARSRWHIPSAGWLIPLTAAAAAVVVWAILRGRTTVAPNLPSAGAVAVAAPPENTPPAPAHEEQRQSPAASSSATDVVSGFRRAVTVEGQASTAPPSARLGGRETIAETDVASVEGRDATGKTGVVSGSPPSPGFGEARRSAERGSGSRTVPIEGQKSAQNVADAAAPPAAAQPASAQTAAAATSAVAPPATPARAAAESTTGPVVVGGVTSRRLDGAAPQAIAKAFGASPPLTIVSPEPNSRWRIVVRGQGVPRGTVQHSTDGGALWRDQQTGVTVTLVAGASPSRSVCWLVGSQGTVLLSTDGASWQRLAFPETTDLVAVRATGDKTATVTASDGRTFRTTDGGLTWMSSPRI